MPPPVPASSATRDSIPDTSRAAAIEGYFGATGTGKSTSIKARVPALGAPCVIFDPKHEYLPALNPPATEAAFLENVNGMAPGHAPVKWALLRPSFDAAIRARQFGRFCAVALAIARRLGRCVIVIDELHLVTDAGRAPASWLELVQTGRAFGCHILAASIRPASIDKDFWTNVTRVRSGRLNFERDCKTVADCLGVDWRELGRLGNLEYFERDLLAGAPAARGVLSIDRS